MGGGGGGREADEGSDLAPGTGLAPPCTLEMSPWDIVARGWVDGGGGGVSSPPPAAFDSLSPLPLLSLSLLPLSLRGSPLPAPNTRFTKRVNTLPLRLELGLGSVLVLGLELGLGSVLELVLELGLCVGWGSGEGKVE